MQETEKDIEQHLFKQVKNHGGVALKYANTWQAGYPDRIVIMPKQRTVFVELKTKAGRVSALQERRIEQLRACGVWTFIIRSKRQAERLAEALAKVPTTEEEILKHLDDGRI